MRLAKVILQTATGGALAATGAQPSFAQTTSAGNEEIIVTAQRRPERPQDVPISLTAVSDEQLERMQVTGTPALGRLVPSLQMMRTGAFTQPYIRGIGKRSGLGVENSVATYIDGVYLASAISAQLDLRGIERVEVLNGPQGTLFGRNATGGVVQIVTRDPAPRAGGEARIEAGTYGYLRGDLYLSDGTERLAGNLAMSLSRNDGYGTNIYTGRTDQDEVDHSFAVRSKWIWQADEALKLTLAGDYQDIDQNFTQLPVAGFPPIGEPRIQDFRDGDQDASNRHRFRYGGLSVRADGEIGDVSVMSLSALRKMRAHYAGDLDVGPLPLISAVVLADQEQFSQEFQLQSGDPSTVQWVAGLYFIRIEERFDPLSFSYGGSYSAELGGRTGRALFSSGAASSYAAYGQGTAALDEATRLTLGLRYTIEHRTVRASGAQTFDNPPLVRPIPGLPLTDQEPFRNENTFRELTWRASLDRHFSGEVMGYVSASRGFQSGGWNLQTPQSAPFGPERLTNFEAGVKYADRAGRIRADATLFYYDDSDLQVSVFTPVGNATMNAASAEAYGLELQINAQLGERTDVTLGLAWQETRYKDFPNAGCVNYDPSASPRYALMACGATGKELPFAPELKFNIGANREVSLVDAGSLLLSAGLAYNSGYFAEPDNFLRQDSFATVDASAEWRTAWQGLSVRLWALNLTGTRYSTTLANLPTAAIYQRPAAPARFGVSIAYAY